MAYNPNLYNMYPQIQQQMTQQPINGLVFIDDIKQGETYQMPPGSISPPLFLRNSNHYLIKTFDASGGSTTELYSFNKVDMDELTESSDHVTKDDLRKLKEEVMEAINGKHATGEDTEQ